MPEHLVLYHYESCPYCRRVRQFLHDAGITMEMRDILLDPEARRDLVLGGGRSTVPCLRIERDGEVEWMYESMDIIDYLGKRFVDG